MNATTLNQVKEGEIVEVTALHSEGTMRRRLRDIGVIEGTKIQCLQKSASGDPIAYLIRGAVIALRKDDSSLIEVTEA